MRKIMLCFMFLLGMVIFAEKLTTDGKDNLNNLKGTWKAKGADGVNTIRFDNGKWQLGYECWEDEQECRKEPNYDKSSGMNFYNIKTAKNGVLAVFFDQNLKQHFAYDTKKKALVFLDNNLNITDVLSVKVR